MICLSLCMIVKNEEAVLARCLESAKGLADEIIIVDTGSTDATREIAEKYTDKVYDFRWIDDFAAARNFAFSKAQGKYIMWLDADDVIEPGDLAEFLQVKAGLDGGPATVMARYNTGFDEAGRVTFSYYRERIVLNCPLAVWEGVAHEVITPFGKLIYTEAAVTHAKIHAAPGDRNLNIYRKARAAGRPFSPRDRFYFARELFYNGLFADGAEEFEGFLACGGGWVENNIEACRFLALCRYGQGRQAEALDALLLSLRYDRPRAELCCDIAKHFFDRGAYQKAVFWYETALACPRNDHSGAFVQPDCYGFLPCIQLCVCYYRLGDMEKSARFNEKAGVFKPDAGAYKSNLKLFEKIFSAN